MRTMSIFTCTLLAAACADPVDLEEEAEEESRSLSRAELDTDVEARRRLGFPADLAHVERLRGSLEDMGSAEFGIPMTAPERQEWDRRAAIQALLDERVEAAVRARADFAGLYIDQLAGGQVVLLTTGDPAAARAELEAVEPRLADDLVVRRVAVSEVELGAALRQLAGDTDRLFPGIAVHSGAVDLPNTALVVRVSADDLADAQAGAEAASASLGGIPVRVEVGEPPVARACTDPEHCTHPMRAGTVIRKGSAFSGYPCTMGFHIKRGTSGREMLTAGHCGTTGSNSWYHRGWGYQRSIGSEQATLYRHNGVDIMRVNIYDTQYSQHVYSKSGAITSAGWPLVGATVCARRGWRKVIDCGTVADADTFWTIEGSTYRLFGAGAGGIAIIGGDSGSPVWQHGQSKAVGIMSAGSSSHVYFGRVQDALDAWNARIP
jgi:hypothetical protein